MKQTILDIAGSGDVHLIVCPLSKRIGFSVKRRDSEKGGHHYNLMFKNIKKLKVFVNQVKGVLQFLEEGNSLESISMLDNSELGEFLRTNKNVDKAG